MCDYHGIGGGGKHCDDYDAQPDASAAETSTAKHCDDNDAQPDRFSHGQRGRDVRYAHTIINAHQVS